MHLKLLDFKVNLIFMEKYVGRLSCAYLKYIGRNWIPAILNKIFYFLEQRVYF